MQFEASAAQVKQATLPHNLMIVMLFAFNLLMVPAVISLHMGMLGLLLPLFSSSATIYFIYRRGKNINNEFVAAHWQLAVKNGRWLLLGYAISAVLILLAWLISLTAHEPSMKQILWTALTRIGLLPTLIAVMVTAVMEASAISQATKREAPNSSINKKHP
ncbi:MAG: hypothetical protein WC742_06125 [Gallionellaceae bacterium]|jgi:glucan phosphoethanolaminetransferase (alkaline phosphatase superfamily)